MSIESTTQTPVQRRTTVSADDGVSLAVREYGPTDAP